MYHVALALDSHKRMDDWQEPVRVGSAKTEDEAQALMRWVEQDLKRHNLYIDHQRCYANEYKGWPGFLAVYDRRTDDTLRYIGCLFYLEDEDAPQA